MGKKVLTRSLLVVSMVNFVASIWFSQYVSGWLPCFVYVMGSFLAMIVAVSFSE